MHFPFIPLSGTPNWFRYDIYQKFWIRRLFFWRLSAWWLHRELKYKLIMDWGWGLSGSNLIGIINYLSNFRSCIMNLDSVYNSKPTHKTKEFLSLHLVCYSEEQMRIDIHIFIPCLQDNTTSRITSQRIKGPPCNPIIVMWVELTHEDRSAFWRTRNATSLTWCLWHLQNRIVFDCVSF